MNFWIEYALFVSVGLTILVGNWYCSWFSWVPAKQTNPATSYGKIFERTELEPEYETVYNESEMTREQESFFENLFMQEEQHPVQTYADYPVPPFKAGHDPDILKMSDLEKEPPVRNKSTGQRVRGNISSYQTGTQQWTVEVVGEEQGYLHISDGVDRTWVNANRFGEFFKKDILLLEVERFKDDRVDVLAIEILQRHSADFYIPDEDMFEAFEKDETMSYQQHA